MSGHHGPVASTLMPCGAMLRSLEAVSGLESNSRVFTVQVQGLLHLQVSSRWVGFSGLRGPYSSVQVVAPSEPFLVPRRGGCCLVFLGPYG